MTMKRGILVAAILVLTACGESAQQTGNAALEPVTLRIDWISSAYHAPFYLGVERGYYKDAGLDLTIREGQGSIQVAQLIGRGEDSFGFATPDSILRGAEAGVPIKSIATLMPVMGQAIYVRAASEITDLQDLNGKSIAITPGGANEALLPAVLDTVGLTPSDIEQITVGSAAKVQTFLNGDVDAMVATAWAHSLFDIGGGARAFTYSDYGVRTVGYSLITSTRMVAEQPGVVQAFVTATLEAWQMAKANPQAALDALAAAVPRHASPERAAGNIKDFASMLTFVTCADTAQPYGYQSLTAWETTQELLQTYGIIEGSVTVRDVLTNTFVAPESTND